MSREQSFVKAQARVESFKLNDCMYPLCWNQGSDLSNASSSKSPSSTSSLQKNSAIVSVVEETWRVVLPSSPQQAKKEPSEEKETQYIVLGVWAWFEERVGGGRAREDSVFCSVEEEARAGLERVDCKKVDVCFIEDIIDPEVGEMSMVSPVEVPIARSVESGVKMMEVGIPEEGVGEGGGQLKRGRAVGERRESTLNCRLASHSPAGLSSVDR